MSSTHPVVIDEDACWDLLALQPVGRIGMCRDDGPLILPVNYAVVDRAIVFRTRINGAALPGNGQQVAFEVDGIDARFHDGWSVLVTGLATRIVGPTADEDTVETWVDGERPVLVAIEVSSITGRVLLHDDIGWAQDLRGYL